MSESASQDRSVLRGLLALEEDRDKASRLMGLLQSGERSLATLTEEERKAFEGAPLVELVLARSWEARHENPQKMVTLAETARVLADNLSRRRYGRKVVDDLRARAWAELGNAYRVADKLAAAETALRRAAVFARSGSGSASLAVRILDYWASLLKDARGFAEAAELLQEVIQCHQGSGNQEALGKALLSLGLVYEHAHEPERAVVVILEALRCISGEGPRPLLLAGLHTLAVNLADCGEYGSARVLLERTRRLYRRSGKLNQLRLSWLEGKIAEGLGELGLAEAKYNTARLAFRREGLNYDSALVSLDLALLLARQERRGELAWLVDDQVRTFRSLGIARELIASLTLLKRSCEKDLSGEILAAQVETIAVTLAELLGREGGKAAGRS